jgi:PAS domain S-box-containing protein
VETTGASSGRTRRRAGSAGRSSKSSAADHIGSRVAAGQRARLEVAIRGPDGRALWIDLEVTPMRGEGAAASSWFAVAYDVTERRRAQDAVAESEERYRRLVEDAPEPVAVHSEGRVVFANAAALALLGASSSTEVVGRPVFDFLHPDYHAIAAERIMKMELVGDPAEVIVERLLRVDGSPVDVELAATPVVWRGAPAIQLSGRPVERQPAAPAPRAEPTARAPRGRVIDLSGLVLELAPWIEGRLAPRAAVSFDLTAARLELAGEAGPLAALVRAVVGQAAGALRGGRGALLVRTRVAELSADEAASFVPPGSLHRGSYLLVEAIADRGQLPPGASVALFAPGFAERFPDSGPGLAAGLELARAHRGALRVHSQPGGGLHISAALPQGDTERRRPARVHSVPRRSAANEAR